MSIDFCVGMIVGSFVGCLWMGGLGMWNTLKAQGKQGAVSPAKPSEPPEEPEAPARLMDPANPPTWRTWRPKREVIEPPVCVCHGIPFEYGQPVMLWPVPDGEPGQIDLLCEEGVGKATPGA